jgi:CRP-like cAMP-binding protein
LAQQDSSLSPRSATTEDWPEQLSLGPAVEYPAGTVLFHQGDSVRDLFLIDAGLVKLVRCEANAREIIVGLRTRNWLLGAAGATMDRPHTTTGEVIEEDRQVPGH